MASVAASTALPRDDADPVRSSECALPGVLSTRFRLPEIAPATVGLKTTSIWQDPPAATSTFAQRLSTTAKFGDAMVADSTLSGRLPPAFETFTVSTALVPPTLSCGNDSDRGWKLSAAWPSPAPPVPSRVTTTGSLIPVWWMVSVAVRCPTAVGLKTTSMSHVPSTARVLAAPDVVQESAESRKSAASRPVIVADDRSIGSRPVLAKLSVCGEESAPTGVGASAACIFLSTPAVTSSGPRYLPMTENWSVCASAVPLASRILKWLAGAAPSRYGAPTTLWNVSASPR